MKCSLPSVKEDISTPSAQDKSAVSAVFEKILEGQQTYRKPGPGPVPAENIMTPSGLPRHEKGIPVPSPFLRANSSEALMPDRLLKNALEKARQISKKSLQKI